MSSGNLPMCMHVFFGPVCTANSTGMLLDQVRDSIDGAEAFPSPRDSSKVIEVSGESPVCTLT